MAITIPAPKIKADQRTVETQIETSKPNIFLEISTSHQPGGYRFSARRVLIEGGVLTMKIDRALFQDPSPIRPIETRAARYSRKNLETIHNELMASIGEDDLESAIEWAERF